MYDFYLLMTIPQGEKERKTRRLGVCCLCPLAGKLVKLWDCTF